MKEKITSKEKLGTKGTDKILSIGKKGLDAAESIGRKGAEVTKKGVKTGGRLLGRSIVVIFLAVGIFCLILAFIGVISLGLLTGIGLGVLAGKPWAIAITMALATILSMITVVLFSMPEGYFTKIAETGTGGLLVILMILAFIFGTLTVFALTTAIIFFLGAILVRRKFGIEAPILSLTSGSLSILLTLFIIWSVISGYVGVIGFAGKFIWLIGAVIIGLLGMILLSGHLRKIKSYVS